MKSNSKNSLKTFTGIAIAVIILITTSCNSNAKQSESQSDETPIEAKVKAPEKDLHMAVITNDINAIRQHIAAGSDLNVKDPFGGSSPLITASLFGNLEAATLLVNAGAELNAKNNEGSTAVHTAAFFCYPEIVKMLLDKEADKTLRNNYGATARESVIGAYSDVKSIYQMFEKQFAPMGLKMDLERIEKTRPEIAEILN